VAPVTAGLLGGKDAFADLFTRMMGRPAAGTAGDEGASDPGFNT
jgi:hypothetical protein